MPRLTPQSYQTLLRVFKKAGYSITRFKGNHYVLDKPKMDRPVIIPKYKEIDVDIIKCNMRTAKMSREEYFEFLADP